MAEEKDKPVVAENIPTNTGEQGDQNTGEEEVVAENDTQTPDELTTLRSKLEEAEAKAAEYLDGWQRSRAEFINFKRRQEQLQQTLRQRVTSELFESLLAVLDDHERAFAAIPEGWNEHEWVKGLTLVGKKLQSTLEKEGLSVMEVKPGDLFDPYYHQALLYEPNEKYEAGQIVEVLQKGYVFGETVLRPAIVRVSSGKPQPMDTQQ